MVDRANNPPAGPSEAGDPSARVRVLLHTLTESGSAVGDLSGREAAELLPLVYDELKRIAQAHMRGERPDHTLQATALVHEAWLRLCGDAGGQWADRAHFLAASALAMRRILVERARAKSGPRRGGDRRRVELGEVATLADEPREELLDLDEALERLEVHDARKARVVHLRYFAGLSLEETAAALGLSLATTKSDWSFARAWLHRELERGLGGERA